MKTFSRLGRFASCALLAGLFTVANADQNNGNQNNNGNHYGWYKDKQSQGGTESVSSDASPSRYVSVPEPETLLLFGTALLIYRLVGRRRKR